MNSVGNVWADEWRRTDRSFADLDRYLDAAVFAAAPERGRIVDIGCGAGATAIRIAAARPAASVIGIDLSERLLAVARSRAGAGRAEAGGPRFILGDAPSTVDDLAPVDLFVSRHGVMFFDDPVATFRKFARAAASGARVIFSCFAERAANAWAVEPLAALDRTMPSDDDGAGPFAFADPDRVFTILSSAGWLPESPVRVDFRYIAGAGADPVGDAVSFFGRIGPAAALLRDARDRDEAERRMADVCRAHCIDGMVAFPATAWLWSAHVTQGASA